MSNREQCDKMVNEIYNITKDSKLCTWLSYQTYEFVLKEYDEIMKESEE